MSIKDYEPYWKLIYDVMEYSLDGTPVMDLHLGRKKVGVIDEKVFLDKLYTLRGQDELESRLARHILEVAPVGCIAGPRGAGKTSTIRYTVREIQAHFPDIRIELFDFKTLFDLAGCQGLDDGNALQRFREILREAVLARLFPSDDTRMFFAWVAAGAPDKTESFPTEIYDDLHDLSHTVLGAAGYDGPANRKTRYNFLRDWISKHPSEYASMYRRSAPKLRTAHVLQAAINLLPFRRIVIIYDNVDRIPAKYQPFFLEVINDGHNSLGAGAGTIVSIRLENIRGPLPRAGEGGDVLNVMLLDEREYPCLLLPEVRKDHMAKVLENRKSFAEDIYRRHGGERLLKDMLVVHSAAVGELIDVQIHRLANDSVRAVVNAYSAFMRYLHKHQMAKHITFSDLFDSGPSGLRHLRTVFFLWLFQEGPDYGMDLHDAVNIDNIDREGANITSLVGEHYLLVTCCLNLTAEMRKNRPAPYAPSFSQVFERMQLLDLKLPAVREALRDLCAVPGAQPRTLEFFQTESDLDTLDEHSSDRLRVTPAGEELATTVCCMVGYVWGRSYLHKPVPTTGVKSYFDLKPAKRIELLYDYVADLARGHLHMLSLVRIKWLKIYGKEWLVQFRSMFGVHNRLQIEKTLDLAISFYADYYKRETNHPFEVLRATFYQLLDQIKLNGEWRETKRTSLARGRKFIRLSYADADRSA